MQYKGFLAKYHYVSDVGVFVGEIQNTSDVVIAFSATTLPALNETMVEAIESYLQSRYFVANARSNHGCHL